MCWRLRLGSNTHLYDLPSPASTLGKFQMMKRLKLQTHTNTILVPYSGSRIAKLSVNMLLILGTTFIKLQMTKDLNSKDRHHPCILLWQQNCQAQHHHAPDFENNLCWELITLWATCSVPPPSCDLLVKALSLTSQAVSFFTQDDRERRQNSEANIQLSPSSQRTPCKTLKHL